MAVTRERINQGMSYELAREMMARNKPNIERIEGLISLTDADLAPWRNLAEPYEVLVLVIDPCPDVYTNVPILQRIATESGKLNLHIFMRDDNKDLMAQFMNGPFESMPVFAFFDKAMSLRSVFIERPKNVTDMRAQKTREIIEANPDFGPVGRSPTDMPEEVRVRYQAAINAMRTASTDFYLGESHREFREIAEELGRGPVGDVKWRGNLMGDAVVTATP
ncbi:MAG: hypothetical protein HW416_693 [Chloroflexi bacterium]|nr:hypothetical protein [Chloroflexota bacterium]